MSRRSITTIISALNKLPVKEREMKIASIVKELEKDNESGNENSRFIERETGSINKEKVVPGTPLFSVKFEGVPGPAVVIMDTDFSFSPLMNDEPDLKDRLG